MPDLKRFSDGSTLDPVSGKVTPATNKPDGSPLDSITPNISSTPLVSTSSVFSTTSDKIAKEKADYAIKEAAYKSEIERAAAASKASSRTAIESAYAQPIQEATQYREDITKATEGQFATDRRASTAALSFVDSRRKEAQKQIDNLVKLKNEAIAKVDIDTQTQIDKQLKDWQDHELKMNEYYGKIAKDDFDNKMKELGYSLDTAKFSEEKIKNEYDRAYKTAQQEIDIAKFNLDSGKFTYQQKQDTIQNTLNSDKFSWQQKVDVINSELAKGKFNLDVKKFNADQIKEAKEYDLKLKQYALDIQKAQDAATPEKYKEWQLAGGLNSGKSFSEFLMSGSGKPATADQQKNAGYAVRMQDSNSTIDLLTSKWKSLGLFGQYWQETVPNFAKSSDQQMLEQAERDFVNSVLRRESGAVISPSEFDNAKKQYFPQPGDTQAVIDQKKRNRINALKGIVNSSGTALSDEFKQSAGKTTYPDLQTYIDMNPDKVDYIKQIKDSYPDWTPDDVMQFLQSDSFSTVGGDTNSAVISKLENKEDGTKGGQCGAFVNRLTGLGVGDSYQSKISKMDSNIKEPEPGMVFTMPYKDTGHVGFILGINNDGTATVKDSNYGLNEKIKTHKIAISKMTGFARV